MVNVYLINHDIGTDFCPIQENKKGDLAEDITRFAYIFFSIDTKFFSSLFFCPQT